jgi:hypothetical protein
MWLGTAPSAGLTPARARGCIGAVPTWITDIRHFPPVDAPQGPAAAAKRARFCWEVVEAATSRRETSPWRSAVGCIGRVGRRACGGRIHVGPVVGGHVAWSCPACGDQGDITGFEGTAHDMSPFVPRKQKLRVWAFDDEEREVLLEATTHIPALRAVVSRGSPAVDLDLALMVQATVDELDQVYTLVEDLSVATRCRRRIQILDDLRMSLCTAIDGF